jgi:ADP-L-glycero-D-manno-heptose 6-epimerase
VRPLPTDELKPLSPTSIYAITKRDHEEMFLSVGRAYGIPAVALRFFNVYGDGEEDKIERNQSSPVSKFIVQANTENKITVFEGSNKMLRDFICVDDVVDLVISNTKGSGIFDLGTGSVCSFQEVAELVSKKFGVPIQTVPFPKHLIGKYQYFTESSEEWQHKFITVSDYVKNYLH